LCGVILILGKATYIKLGEVIQSLALPNGYLQNLITCCALELFANRPVVSETVQRRPVKSIVNWLGPRFRTKTLLKHSADHFHKVCGGGVKKCDIWPEFWTTVALKRSYSFEIEIGNFGNLRRRWIAPYADRKFRPHLP